MGYTHYWTQPTDYTVKAWKQIGEDIAAILKDVQHVQGIPLAWDYNETGKQPQIDGETIRFNGLGEDGHETFYLSRVRAPLEPWEKQGGYSRGGSFCKTARKPYDLAVVACLAYFAALENKPWRVSSDGEGLGWLEGVALARRCAPRMANQIDIPMPIMKADRWDNYKSIGYSRSSRYGLDTCIDGAVYVYDRKDESRAYRFPNVEEARAYFATFKEKPLKVKGFGRVWDEGGKSLFNSSGCFDKKREDALDRQQTAILKALVECAASEGRNIPPPAYARPNEMPGVAREQETLADLYRLCA